MADVYLINDSIIIVQETVINIPSECEWKTKYFPFIFQVKTKLIFLLNI